MVESSCKWRFNFELDTPKPVRCLRKLNPYLSQFCSLTVQPSSADHEPLKLQHPSQPAWLSGVEILSEYWSQSQLISSVSMKILYIRCQQTRQMRDGTESPMTQNWQFSCFSVSVFVCPILQVVLALKNTLLWGASSLQTGIKQRHILTWYPRLLALCVVMGHLISYMLGSDIHLWWCCYTSQSNGLICRIASGC